MPKKTDNFSSQLKSLEQITDKLQSGDLELEESLKLFEKGLALAESLKEQLKQIENKMETIKIKFSKNLDLTD
jgi:exodeoxyribonuclease VII small subunit